MREKLSLNTVSKTNKTRKRIGRGPGSGSWKTSGRGHSSQAVEYQQVHKQYVYDQQ